jgi:hypothetical protein
VNVDFRFLSLNLSLLTDVEAVAAYCRELFSRFLDPDARHAAILEIRTEGNDTWRVRDGTIDATVDERSWLEGIATARVLETVGNEVEDHDLFHAAALSREGRGLILFGESGFGKSVLTLALLARGWRFFSDEVAAVAHRDGRLVPFPKAIELRREAADLAGLPYPDEPLPRGKALFDPEALSPACLSGPCPPSAVVFLEDAGGGDKAREEKGLLRLSVHRKAEEVPEAVNRLDGVVRAYWDGERAGFPALGIEYQPGTFAAWRLDEVLGARGVLIVDTSAEKRAPRDFDRETRLERMETHAGLELLLTRFRGRKTLERRLEAHDGRLGDLFISMLDRFEGTRFFRIAVGRLESMIERLEETVG